MSYLPLGYEELQTSNNYISLSKLPEGEHRFRIVQRPIAGWVDWKEKKPYRYRPNARPSSSFDPEKPMKPFWACYVWDYSRDGLFMVEVTQSSILKALTQYAKDEEWGDFTTYDIKIIKEGSGMETKYHVSPVPHKPMRDDILKALKATPINLEALYDGKDPWECVGTAVKKEITVSEAKYLDELIGTDEGLRENIIKFLKGNGYGDTLDCMPSEMYEKMIVRAMQNKKERDDAAQRQKDDFKSTKTIDFASIIKPSAPQEAYPF